MNQEMTKEQRERIEKRRRRKKIRRIRAIILSILGCLLILVLTVVGVRALGKRSLQKKADQEMSMTSKEEVGAEEAEEGIVYYEGEKYRYNKNIMTFLFMGIDNDDSFEASEQMGRAGQSDCNFLAVMDTKKKTVKLIGISRDTMTDIAIYDENGEYMRTVQEHLAIQYAYGDGSKKSCELQVEAVSNLFYGLPIHGYCAINFDGITVLNDAVGGVDVTVLEDMTWIDQTLIKDREVRLMGKHAFYYVKARNTKNFASNNLRIERQKQYLKGYVNKVLEQTKKDITVPLSITNKLKDYMITDVSMDQITYLASELLNYSIDLDNIRSIEGEVIQPEDSRYEQFHVDYDALYELILEVFYEKVPAEQNMNDIDA